MRKYTRFVFTLATLLFLQMSAFSQGGYFFAKGKIIDKYTLLPLSNAYISMPSIGYGTAPNLDGDFIFQYPKLSRDSLVVVSLVGYKSLKMKGTDLRLEDNVFELEPIPLYDAHYGLSDVRIMLRAAVDSIKSNYNSNPYYQLGFYHEQVDLPGLGAIKLNEGVVRVERFPGQKDKLEKVKLLRGRRIEWKGPNQQNQWMGISKRNRAGLQVFRNRNSRFSGEKTNEKIRFQDRFSDDNLRGNSPICNSFLAIKQRKKRWKKWKNTSRS
ncbi:MAG: hypothetical protein IPO04_18420 [Cytophagaceae bacterium]|nr:hypothetical protein [Cytophagaceae bacterium]